VDEEQVNMCDPSLTRAIPQCFRDKNCTRYKAVYKCPVYLKASEVYLLKTDEREMIGMKEQRVNSALSLLV